MNRYSQSKVEADPIRKFQLALGGTAQPGRDELNDPYTKDRDKEVREEKQQIEFDLIFCSNSAVKQKDGESKSIQKLASTVQSAFFFFCQRKMLTRSSASVLASHLSYFARFASSVSEPSSSSSKHSSSSFEFTPLNMIEVEKTFAKYPKNQRASACIPLLHLAQKQNNNFLTLSAMNKIAHLIGVNPLRVYEVWSILRSAFVFETQSFVSVFSCMTDCIILYNVQSSARGEIFDRCLWYYSMPAHWSGGCTRCD